MNIKEFALLHCKDTLRRAEREEEVFDISGFSFDAIIQDEDGAKIPVLYTLSHQVPLMDVLSMGRADFEKIWPQKECLDMYDTYVSTLTILEGEDALFAIRNRLRAEQLRIAEYDALIPEYQ